MAESGGLGGEVEFVTDGLLRDAAAAGGEQELRRSAVTGMRERPTVRAQFDDLVDERDGVLVEGNHAFGGELAERDFQPGSVLLELVDAVQFQVE